ncbi:hypothetical protein HNR23_002300 [Nocardiopsis mwathae]|uniref:Uncharacterized protein n=1 Tax=Nocardiopsis mwathae TaxID=1472723 RepID=A0A7W9YHH1_9ACTN|nr:hypothetical protein [Nocardiopsis mwathae]MBB6172240.1 hypothetical protein [Nocardiopsis mwathae]
MTTPSDTDALQALLDTSNRLRAHFSDDVVGKLPRVTCGGCRESRSGECAKHSKSRCKVCDQWISPQHIHIDFVGHADVTGRLLDVDPAWNWDFLATDDNGMPILDHDRNGNPVGLWITLTVGGITRKGYGSCPSNQADAVKVLIGDALRNAAMRFGVALNLWSKGERADPTAENAIAQGGKARRRLRKGEQPERVTDKAWLLDALRRAQGAEDDAELVVLEAEAKAKYDALEMTQHDGKGLRAEIDKRRRMLTQNKKEEEMSDAA